MRQLGWPIFLKARFSRPKIYGLALQSYGPMKLGLPKLGEERALYGIGSRFHQPIPKSRIFYYDQVVPIKEPTTILGVYEHGKKQKLQEFRNFPSP
ncbi:unnamed protein product [Dovyalis caffra]|uniref:Uncharacterized protein n=1 Tax=Dovyalis caffra TaxID=77055 RepID=A0AAV1SNZ7_9ROSI|nr:unnamed protein product [Dovyalis caffra]